MLSKILPIFLLLLVSDYPHVAKAGGQAGVGEGGGGGPPLERVPCMRETDQRAIQSAAKTEGSCSSFSCPGGCCRYHTAFLTCDTRNLYAHQACICNQLTNNTDDRGDSGGGEVDVGPPPVVHQGGAGGRPSNQRPNCLVPTPWQELGLSFQNCNETAACAGVTPPNPGDQICCKKTFCWCGVYDVFEAECVD